MKKTTKAPSEKTRQALLERHGCPVPFHEVRTLFLGNIAMPVISASPLRIVAGLWGGELPEFENRDEANELIGALVQGLWNDLTRHQKRGQPFQLTRMPAVTPTENLAHYGIIRREELDGFVEGLFNGEETVDLPERAHEAVEHLAELGAMMASICEPASRDSDADDPARIGKAFKHLRELTRIMETEMNKAVLSCTRARRRMLRSVRSEKPTVH